MYQRVGQRMMSVDNPTATFPNPGHCDGWRMERNVTLDFIQVFSDSLSSLSDYPHFCGDEKLIQMTVYKRRFPQ